MILRKIATVLEKIYLITFRNRMILMMINCPAKKNRVNLNWAPLCKYYFGGFACKKIKTERQNFGDYLAVPIKEASDWFMIFDAIKKEIIEKLDKEYWQKYLDYDAVDKFRESGEPDEEEVFGQYNMLYVLGYLAAAQNLIQKVRGTGYGICNAESDLGNSSGT